MGNEPLEVIVYELGCYFDECAAFGNYRACTIEAMFLWLVDLWHAIENRDAIRLFVSALEVDFFGMSEKMFVFYYCIFYVVG